MRVRSRSGIHHFKRSSVSGESAIGIILPTELDLSVVPDTVGMDHGSGHPDVSRGLYSLALLLRATGGSLTAVLSPGLFLVLRLHDCLARTRHRG